MSCHSYVFIEKVENRFYLLMRAGKEIRGCHGQIRLQLLEGGIYLGTEKLLRYSMQLAMLRQLLIAKKITEKEHQKIEYRLKKDYGIISNITSCNLK